MIRTYVLAASAAEADAVARAHGLARWRYRYVTEALQLRGCWRPSVLVTVCWPFSVTTDRERDARRDIKHILRVVEARTRWVNCA